jgi:hypothetical protein
VAVARDVTRLLLSERSRIRELKLWDTKKGRYGWDQMVQHSTVRVWDYAIQTFAMYTLFESDE